MLINERFIDFLESQPDITNPTVLKKTPEIGIKESQNGIIHSLTVHQPIKIVSSFEQAHYSIHELNQRVQAIMDHFRSCLQDIDLRTLVFKGKYGGFDESILYLPEGAFSEHASFVDQQELLTAQCLPPKIAGSPNLSALLKDLDFADGLIHINFKLYPDQESLAKYLANPQRNNPYHYRIALLQSVA